MEEQIARTGVDRGKARDGEEKRGMVEAAIKTLLEARRFRYLVFSFFFLSSSSPLPGDFRSPGQLIKIRNYGLINDLENPVN